MEEKRISPMSTIDKELLRELLKPHLEIIESKASGMSMVVKKNKVWSNIMTNFNTTATSGERSLKQLKKSWENMKTLAKKSNAVNKRERYRTGGGTLPSSSNVTDELEKVLDVVGPSLDPLPNAYDDDASINGDVPDAAVDLESPHEPALSAVSCAPSHTK